MGGFGFARAEVRKFSFSEIFCPRVSQVLLLRTLAYRLNNLLQVSGIIRSKSLLAQKRVSRLDPMDPRNSGCNYRTKDLELPHICIELDDFSAHVDRDAVPDSRSGTVSCCISSTQDFSPIAALSSTSICRAAPLYAGNQCY